MSPNAFVARSERGQDVSPDRPCLDDPGAAQARGSLSGAELAERLEVDRRTVRRYITMLQDLGIPIKATRGPYGSYHLRAGSSCPR